MALALKRKEEQQAAPWEEVELLHVLALLLLLLGSSWPAKNASKNKLDIHTVILFGQM